MKKRPNRIRRAPERERPRDLKTEHDAFAERLRLVAESPEIGSVRALAAISGVKFESTVHAWLKKSEPKRDALKKIADAAHVSIDWLVSGEPYLRLRFYDLRESQGFNEAFLESPESSKPQSTRWAIFNREWIGSYHGTATELGENVEQWRNPVAAVKKFFAVRIAGTDGAMPPLIDDGDIVIVMRTWTPSGAIAAPFLLSIEGKVVARLVRFDGKGRSVIGSRTSELKFGEPEQFMRVTLSGGEGRRAAAPAFDWPQVRILGRIIWCGRSLLGPGGPRANHSNRE